MLKYCQLAYAFRTPYPPPPPPHVNTTLNATFRHVVTDDCHSSFVHSVKLPPVAINNQSCFLLDDARYLLDSEGDPHHARSEGLDGSEGRGGRHGRPCYAFGRNPCHRHLPDQFILLDPVCMTPVSVCVLVSPYVYLCAVLVCMQIRMCVLCLCVGRSGSGVGRGPGYHHLQRLT